MTIDKKSYSFNIDTSKKKLSFDDIINCWPPNRTFFDDLIYAINNNNLVPLIGAGLTKNLTCDDEGFPSWSELLLKIANKEGVGENEINEIKKIISNSNMNNNYEYAAQILENICGKRIIQNDLIKLFSPNKLDKCKIKKSPISCLPKLNSNIILTTNYDTAIERTYYFEKYSDEKDNENINIREKEVIKILTPRTTTREFVNVIKNRTTESASKPILYKFHGDVKDNGETHDLILSKNSYDKVYGEIDHNNFSKDLIRNLYTFLFAKTILFIGCSLEKDRILNIISTNTEVEHYAFVGCGSCKKEEFSNEKANEEARKRSEMLHKMNINAIFYPRYYRDSIKELLTNLADKNTSINVTSMYPKKSEWMLEYFGKKLESYDIKNYIIIFGGVNRDLRDKDSQIIKSLEQWLGKNKESKIFFCYDSGTAAIHRSQQVKTDIQRKSTDEKLEEIRRIPELFTNKNIENKNQRIFTIPIKYDLTGYAILSDDKLFWNIITEQRSSDSPIIELNIHDGKNKNFINYIKYALEQTMDVLNNELNEVKIDKKKLNENSTKHIEIRDPDPNAIEADIKNLNSVIEIVNNILL